MGFRKKLKRKSSKRLFTKTADSVNPRNATKSPMRGGYRM